jgi:hypothetical protein
LSGFPFTVQPGIKLPKFTVRPPCHAERILVNLAAVEFEAYLVSKKIDSASFQTAESELWEEWKIAFEQQHPKSFTAQKLYLINPIRRKYPLKVVATEAPSEKKESGQPLTESPESTTLAKPKPVVPRPVFKPKPKTN